MLNFNGVDIPEFVRVKAVNISALPSINTNLKGSMAGFGVLSGKTSFDEKTITASIIIIVPEGYTLQKCARELAVWLKGNDFGLSPLIIKDDADIRYMAKLSSSVDLSDLIYAGEGEIQFVVPSGCGESASEKTVTGTAKASVNYSGSQRAFPTIEITVGGTASTVTVNHVQKGNSVFLNGSFKSGDKIFIDCSKHLIKVNDEVHMEMIGLTSKFIELSTGTNEITCSVSGSVIKVTYRERFL